MIIEVAKLVDEPLLLDSSIPRQELRFSHEEAQLADDVAVRLRAELLEDLTVRVQGNCRTVIEFPCSRCLQPFARPQDIRFDLYYLPQTSVTRGAEEIELKTEDLEVGFYDGVHLDLNLVVSEQLVFAVPMKPLCREDCRGLCPKCGSNLNQQECLCEGEVFSPWREQLQKVKEELKSRKE